MQDGDVDAFEFLCKQSASIIFNIAPRITPSKEDAEDVVQETSLANWTIRTTPNSTKRSLQSTNFQRISLGMLRGQTLMAQFRN